MEYKLKKILIGMIIILVILLLFFLVLKPGLQKYVLNKQIEAQVFIYKNMIDQLQKTGAYQVPLGNQTLILVPYK